MPVEADTVIERQRKLWFAVLLAFMGFAGLMTGNMNGDAFAFHCVGLMGFLSGAIVAEKYIKGKATNDQTS
jgi:hypothetical protein